MIRYLCISLIFLIGFQTCSAENMAEDSLQRRKQFVIAGNALGYVGAMGGMYSLWYKDYPMTKFHFHNDNADWFQIDKVGHMYSCYYEGVVGIDQLIWAGFDREKAIIIGGLYGSFIQTGIEVLDGFSEEWGASWGDFIANTAGSGLVIGQALAWNEQRIWMKVSFQPTDYPEIRPDLLGSNFLENVFKDYNGQTYWLSGNIKSFLPEDSKFPAWLNLAVGYGIDGFVGSTDNIFRRDEVEYDYSNIPRSRQFYLSPDIDLTRIPTDKKWIKISCRIVNCLKFPLPGIGFDTEKRDVKFNLIQF